MYFLGVAIGFYLGVNTTLLYQAWQDMNECDRKIAECLDRMGKCVSKQQEACEKLQDDLEALTTQPDGRI